jgi:hypothetical protein
VIISAFKTIKTLEWKVKNNPASKIPAISIQNPHLKDSLNHGQGWQVKWIQNPIMGSLVIKVQEDYREERL